MKTRLRAAILCALASKTSEVNSDYIKELRDARVDLARRWEDWLR